MLTKLVIAAAVLLFPLASQAIQSTFYGSETVNGSFTADTDQRYDRYADSYFGATVELIGSLFDEEGNYLVTSGETWVWTFNRVDKPQYLTSYELSYIGGDNWCWSDGSCGAYSGFSYGITAPCLPEGEYRVLVYHNDSLMGSYDWRPVRFKPAVLDVWMPKVISPQSYAFYNNAGTGDFDIIVTDDLGCSRPLDDVEVTVRTYISSDEFAHKHMQNEVGTGNFINLGFESVVTEFPPSITGKTNAYGIYQTAYKAGEHGIQERVEVELKRPATSIDPAVGGTALSMSLGIEVHNLERMTTNDGPIIFADGGTCPHEPYANWFLPSTKDRMITIAETYFYLTGRKLSLNDSSLKYGGVIDNKHGGGRESDCHISHRRGNDIDLNKADSGEVDMLEAILEVDGEQLIVDGEPYVIINFLTELAARAGGKRHDEEPIHYRFPE